MLVTEFLGDQLEQINDPDQLGIIQEVAQARVTAQLQTLQNTAEGSEQPFSFAIPVVEDQGIGPARRLYQEMFCRFVEQTGVTHAKPGSDKLLDTRFGIQLEFLSEELPDGRITRFTFSAVQPIEPLPTEEITSVGLV